MADDVFHDQVVRVGGDHNYPPYEFINENGLPDGYNTELTQAIAEVMGIKVKIELGSWDVMRKRLDIGELDVLQGMSYSTKRNKLYNFSPPHAVIHQSIFARKGEGMITVLSELRNKEVIVQNRGIMHDHLLEINVDAELVLVDTHVEALRLLASGKHDYALVANLPGQYLGRELELSNIVPVSAPFGAQRYGYSVSKGNEVLLAKFSEGLAILKNTGRQQAIYDKWLGPLEKSGLPWRKIGLSTAAVSALLLLILGSTVIWNRALRREVAHRTQEIQLQQQQLIHADRMTTLGILVSSVAHEINNPTSLLLLNLPVLKDVHQDIEEILEQHSHVHGDFYLGGLKYSRIRDDIGPMLDDLIAGTQRIRLIIDDLRDFARQYPPDLSESVDFNSVVATAIRLVDNTIRKSTNHFIVTYGDNLPCFKGSAQRIEQVVINLIVNACQALESTEQGITIHTSYNPEDEFLLLEVQDHGCGIEQEHLSRLFDPFFTTKREAGGMGLGLSVSIGIAQEHGGTLVYDSPTSKGTCATLSLPAIKERD